MEEGNDLLSLCAEFVNSTNQNIFLTGKAGTGKTTFLKNLAESTHKSFIILAPTGIAALNAGGSTIHSQFLFPFGSFIPDRYYKGDVQQQVAMFSQKSLDSRHPLNKIRKQVLRGADLIIIDEVSMLRADMLDAIDYRLRRARGNMTQAFGGAQMLFIGDLFQLPPIVKDREWRILSQYYRSMYFFDALCLRDNKLVHIELNKIFRQKDFEFVDILNRLRDNQSTAEDIARLNEHYEEEDKIEAIDQGQITITTHNKQAFEINKKKLEEIKSPSAYFRASINNDFPEHLYPVDEELELKKGAQVMFIRNDSSGENKYYNGKLAIVTKIHGTDVTVEMKDDGESIVLTEEEWENKKYTVNEESKEIEEQVIGSYKHLPVKPAWAVTVHKSQGLTFDKAIIDVGRAFAPGQVYVALSRLRSIDGLTLRTKISSSVIRNNPQVAAFSQTKNNLEQLSEALALGRSDYLIKNFLVTFDLEHIEKELNDFKYAHLSKTEFDDEEMKQAIHNLTEAFASERKNSTAFKSQLYKLSLNKDEEQLKDRLTKGCAYYMQFIKKQMKAVFKHQKDVEQFSKVKSYLNDLEEIDQLISNKLRNLYRLEHIASCILDKKEVYIPEEIEESIVKWRKGQLAFADEYAKLHPKRSKKKSGRTRKKTGGGEKVDTYQETFALFKSGKSVKEIAKIRDYATSTIQGHLAKGIEDGLLKLEDAVDKDSVDVLLPYFKGKPEVSLGEAFNFFDKSYNYDVLKMVRAAARKS